MNEENIQQADIHDEGSSPEDRWPSVPFAYDFVVPSYQLMATRLEAIDSRIQGIQTFAATLTLGVPIVGQSIRRDIHYTSAWFIGVLVVFASIVVLSFVARTRGHLQMASPRLIYERTLHLSEWEFKRDVMYMAGQHFDGNVALINQKGCVGNWLSALVLIETILAACWIAFSC